MKNQTYQNQSQQNKQKKSIGTCKSHPYNNYHFRYGKQKKQQKAITSNLATKNFNSSKDNIIQDQSQQFKQPMSKFNRQPTLNSDKIQSKQIKLYKERIAKLQNRLQQKNSLLKNKEIELINMMQKVTQMEKQRHEQSREYQLSFNKDNQIPSFRNYQHRTNFNQQHLNLNVVKKQVVSSLNDYNLNDNNKKNCINCIQRQKQSNQNLTQTIIELKSQLQKYKKKYQVLQQLLKKRGLEHEQSLQHVNRKLKEQKEIVQKLRQQLTLIEQENICLREKIDDLEIQRQEYEQEQVQYKRIIQKLQTQIQKLSAYVSSNNQVKSKSNLDNINKTIENIKQKQSEIPLALQNNYCRYSFGQQFNCDQQLNQAKQPGKLIKQQNRVINPQEETYCNNDENDQHDQSFNDKLQVFKQSLYLDNLNKDSNSNSKFDKIGSQQMRNNDKKQNINRKDTNDLNTQFSNNMFKTFQTDKNQSQLKISTHMVDLKLNNIIKSDKNQKTNSEFATQPHLQNKINNLSSVNSVVDQLIKYRTSMYEQSVKTQQIGLKRSQQPAQFGLKQLKSMVTLQQGLNSYKDYRNNLSKGKQIIKDRIKQDPNEFTNRSQYYEQNKYGLDQNKGKQKLSDIKHEQLMRNYCSYNGQLISINRDRTQKNDHNNGIVKDQFENTKAKRRTNRFIQTKDRHMQYEQQQKEGYHSSIQKDYQQFVSKRKHLNSNRDNYQQSIRESTDKQRINKNKMEKNNTLTNYQNHQGNYLNHPQYQQTQQSNYRHSINHHTHSNSKNKLILNTHSNNNSNIGHAHSANFIEHITETAQRMYEKSQHLTNLQPELAYTGQNNYNKTPIMRNNRQQSLHKSNTLNRSLSCFNLGITNKRQNSLSSKWVDFVKESDIKNNKNPLQSFNFIAQNRSIPSFNIVINQKHINSLLNRNSLQNRMKNPSPTKLDKKAHVIARSSSANNLHTNITNNRSTPINTAGYEGNDNRFNKGSQLKSNLSIKDLIAHKCKKLTII